MKLRQKILIDITDMGGSPKSLTFLAKSRGIDKNWMLLMTQNFSPEIESIKTP